MTPYLRNEKGIYAHDIYNYIYPTWTYSYLMFLCLLTPISEYSGYKFMVVLGRLAELTTRIILIFGNVGGVPDIGIECVSDADS